MPTSPADETRERRTPARRGHLPPAECRPKPDLSVAFLLLPEFTLLAFTCFVEALRHAADEGDLSRPLHCRWTVLGPSLAPVRASCGVEMSPWELLRDPRDFDYIVVVGGLVRGHGRIAAAVYEYLRTAAEHGVPLVGLCTGSFALARAGLMRDRRCCVHWFHVREFLEEFPDHIAVATELFVIDRGRITCAGGTGVVDLAVHLIDRHCGRARAMKSLRQMLIERIREPTDPPPRVGFDGIPDAANPLVRRAVLLMEQYPGQRIPVARFAEDLRVSERQLERAFETCLGTSPAGYARRLRLQHARWLIANTRKPVTEIAFASGFADASHFGRCYRKEFGVSPLRDRGARRG